jgi:hypothetical protein
LMFVTATIFIFSRTYWHNFHSDTKLQGFNGVA